LTGRAAPRPAAEPFPQTAPLDWTLPTKERWRAYGFWSAWVAVAFFSVYPTLNWITALRAQPWHLYLSAELSIPFVPELISVYLSMFVLFLIPPFLLPAVRMPALGKQLIAGTLLGGLVFLLLPAELGFPREVPASPGYAKIYAALFGLDRPHNLVPSLHVYFSAAIALACAAVARPLTRALLLVWLGVIVLSTLLTHQHHVVDIVAAFALLFIVRRRYEVTHA
jgi:hypothetical protein